MRDVLVSLMIMVWGLTMIGGSIWLYGWQGWSGWWIVLGILLAGACKDSKYRTCKYCGRNVT